MEKKSVPVSIRLSSQEMAMLASLSEEIEATPSESIRDLIRKEHRRQREELCHEQALREEEEERFGPLLRRLQGKEAQDGLPVAFLIRSILWMMESSALLRAGLDADDDSATLAITIVRPGQT